MERRVKVELFDQIRREYEFGAGTIRGVAQQLGCIDAWCDKRCRMRYRRSGSVWVERVPS